MERSDDLLCEISASSYEYQQDILPSIKKSFYYNSSTKSFTFKKILTVHNSDVMKKFVERRKSMKNSGYSDKELSEMYGFLAVDSLQVQEICKKGLKIGNYKMSVLGNPEMGAQISRYADVLPPKPGSYQKGSLIMFKVIKGKIKTVTENFTAVQLDPTPNYDCHMSKTALSDTMNLTQQQVFDSSQMYLYEYEDYCLEDFPSQILPCAVIEFEFRDPRPPETISMCKYLPYNIQSSSSGSTPATNQPAGLSTDVADEEYITWNGKLCVKGAFSCDVSLISSTDYFKPTRLGTTINITNRSDIKRAESKYLGQLTGVRKNEEGYWRGRYINICELHPKPDSQLNFKKIVAYLNKKQSISVIKPDPNTDLLLLPEGSLTQQLGLSPPHQQSSTVLHCMFLLRQSAKFKSPIYTAKVYKTQGEVIGIQDYENKTKKHIPISPINVATKQPTINRSNQSTADVKLSMDGTNIMNIPHFQANPTTTLSTSPNPPTPTPACSINPVIQSHHVIPNYSGKWAPLSTSSPGPSQIRTNLGKAAAQQRPPATSCFDEGFNTSHSAASRLNLFTVQKNFNQQFVSEKTNNALAGCDAYGKRLDPRLSKTSQNDSWKNNSQIGTVLPSGQGFCLESTKTPHIKSGLDIYMYRFQGDSPMDMGSIDCSNNCDLEKDSNISHTQALHDNTNIGANSLKVVHSMDETSPLKGISSVDDMKDFLNATITREEKKYSLSKSQSPEKNESTKNNVVSPCKPSVNIPSPVKINEEDADMRPFQADHKHASTNSILPSFDIGALSTVDDTALSSSAEQSNCNHVLEQTQETIEEEALVSPSNTSHYSTKSRLEHLASNDSVNSSFSQTTTLTNVFSSEQSLINNLISKVDLKPICKVEMISDDEKEKDYSVFQLPVSLNPLLCNGKVDNTVCENDYLSERATSITRPVNSKKTCLQDYRTCECPVGTFSCECPQVLDVDNSELCIADVTDTLLEMLTAVETTENYINSNNNCKFKPITVHSIKECFEPVSPPAKLIIKNEGIPFEKGTREINNDLWLKKSSELEGSKALNKEDATEIALCIDQNILTKNVSVNLMTKITNEANTELTSLVFNDALINKVVCDSLVEVNNDIDLFVKNKLNGREEQEFTASTKSLVNTCSDDESSTAKPIPTFESPSISSDTKITQVIGSNKKLDRSTSDVESVSTEKGEVTCKLISTDKNPVSKQSLQMNKNGKPLIPHSRTEIPQKDEDVLLKLSNLDYSFPMFKETLEEEEFMIRSKEDTSPEQTKKTNSNESSEIFNELNLNSMSHYLKLLNSDVSKNEGTGMTKGPSTPSTGCYKQIDFSQEESKSLTAMQQLFETYTEESDSDSGKEHSMSEYFVVDEVYSDTASDICDISASTTSKMEVDWEKAKVPESQSTIIESGVSFPHKMSKKISKSESNKLEKHIPDDISDAIICLTRCDDPQSTLGISELQTILPSSSNSELKTILPSTANSEHKTKLPSTANSEHKTILPSSANSELKTILPSTANSEHKTKLPSTATCNSEHKTKLPSTANSEHKTILPSSANSEHKTKLPSTATCNSEHKTKLPSTAYSEHKTILPSSANSELKTILPSSANSKTMEKDKIGKVHSTTLCDSTTNKSKNKESLFEKVESLNSKPPKHSKHVKTPAPKSGRTISLKSIKKSTVLSSDIKSPLKKNIRHDVSPLLSRTKFDKLKIRETHETHDKSDDLSTKRKSSKSSKPSAPPILKSQVTKCNKDHQRSKSDCTMTHSIPNDNHKKKSHHRTSSCKVKDESKDKASLTHKLTVQEIRKVKEINKNLFHKGKQSPHKSIFTIPKVSPVKTRKVAEPIAKEVLKQDAANCNNKSLESILSENLKSEENVIEKLLKLSTTTFKPNEELQNCQRKSANQTSENRKARQFHPYDSPKKKKKKQWASFNLPVSDLQELMQDLTSSSFKRVPRRNNMNSYHCHRRFLNYSFRRSAVPSMDECEKIFESAPDDLEIYEQKKKMADMIEEKFSYVGTGTDYNDLIFEQENKIYSGPQKEETNLQKNEKAPQNKEHCPNITDSTKHPSIPKTVHIIETVHVSPTSSTFKLCRSEEKVDDKDTPTEYMSTNSNLIKVQISDRKENNVSIRNNQDNKEHNSKTVTSPVRERNPIHIDKAELEQASTRSNLSKIDTASEDVDIISIADSVTSTETNFILDVHVPDKEYPVNWLSRKEYLNSVDCPISKIEDSIEGQKPIQKKHSFIPISFEKQKNNEKRDSTPPSEILGNFKKDTNDNLSKKPKFMPILFDGFSNDTNDALSKNNVSTNLKVDEVITDVPQEAVTPTVNTAKVMGIEKEITTDSGKNVSLSKPKIKISPIVFDLHKNKSSNTITKPPCLNMFNVFETMETVIPLEVNKNMLTDIKSSEKTDNVQDLYSIGRENMSNTIEKDFKPQENNIIKNDYINKKTSTKSPDKSCSQDIPVKSHQVSSEISTTKPTELNINMVNIFKATDIPMALDVIRKKMLNCQKLAQKTKNLEHSSNSSISSEMNVESKESVLEMSNVPIVLKIDTIGKEVQDVSNLKSKSKSNANHIIDKTTESTSSMTDNGSLESTCVSEPQCYISPPNGTCDESKKAVSEHLPEENTGIVSKGYDSTTLLREPSFLRTSAKVDIMVHETTCKVIESNVKVSSVKKTEASTKLIVNNSTKKNVNAKENISTHGKSVHSKNKSSMKNCLGPTTLTSTLKLDTSGIIEDVETMRHLLNCDIEEKPQKNKGSFPKLIPIQVPVACRVVKQCNIEDKLKLLHHEITIKPVSSNLSNQLKTLSSEATSGCFKQPVDECCNNQDKSKNMNIDESFSQPNSNASTPVKDERKYPLSTEIGVPHESTYQNQAEYVFVKKINIEKVSKTVRSDADSCKQPEASVENLKSTPATKHVVKRIWDTITDVVDFKPTDPRTLIPFLSPENKKTNIKTDPNTKESSLKTLPKQKSATNNSGLHHQKKKIGQQTPSKVVTVPGNTSQMVAAPTDLNKPSTTQHTEDLKKKTYGLHPKRKEYWHHTVSMIEFVTRNIKYSANQYLCGYGLIMFEHFSSDPRRELQNLKKTGVKCPHTGLIIERKKPKTKNSCDKTCSKNVKNFNDKKRPLICSKESSDIRLLQNSKKCTAQNKKTPETLLHANCEKKTSPNASKVQKVHKIIPGTKRKAAASLEFKAEKVSKKDETEKLMTPEDPLRAELLTYALNTMSSPTLPNPNERKNIVLPVFQPLKTIDGLTAKNDLEKVADNNLVTTAIDVIASSNKGTHPLKHCEKVDQTDHSDNSSLSSPVKHSPEIAIKKNLIEGQLLKDPYLNEKEQLKERHKTASKKNIECPMDETEVVKNVKKDKFHPPQKENQRTLESPISGQANEKSNKQAEKCKITSKLSVVIPHNAQNWKDKENQKDIKTGQKPFDCKTINTTNTLKMPHFDKKPTAVVSPINSVPTVSINNVTNLLLENQNTLEDGEIEDTDDEEDDVLFMGEWNLHDSINRVRNLKNKRKKQKKSKIDRTSTCRQRSFSDKAISTTAATTMENNEDRNQSMQVCNAEPNNIMETYTSLLTISDKLEDASQSVLNNPSLSDNCRMYRKSSFDYDTVKSPLCSTGTKKDENLSYNNCDLNDGTFKIPPSLSTDRAESSPPRNICKAMNCSVANVGHITLPLASVHSDISAHNSRDNIKKQMCRKVDNNDHDMTVRKKRKVDKLQGDEAEFFGEKDFPFKTSATYLEEQSHSFKHTPLDSLSGPTKDQEVPFREFVSQAIHSQTKKPHINFVGLNKLEENTLKKDYLAEGKRTETTMSYNEIVRTNNPEGDKTMSGAIINSNFVQTDYKKPFENSRYVHPKHHENIIETPVKDLSIMTPILKNCQNFTQRFSNLVSNLSILNQIQPNNHDSLSRMHGVEQNQKLASESIKQSTFNMGATNFPSLKPLFSMSRPHFSTFTPNCPSFMHAELYSAPSSSGILPLSQNTYQTTCSNIIQHAPWRSVVPDILPIDQLSMQRKSTNVYNAYTCMTNTTPVPMELSGDYQTFPRPRSFSAPSDRASPIMTGLGTKEQPVKVSPETSSALHSRTTPPLLTPKSNEDVIASNNCAGFSQNSSITVGSREDGSRGPGSPADRISPVLEKQLRVNTLPSRHGQNLLMLEDAFVLYKNISVLSRLLARVSVHGTWIVLIHERAFSQIKEWSTGSLSTDFGLDSIQRYALISGYRHVNRVKLVSHCQCSQTASHLTEITACLFKLRTQSYPIASSAVIITDYVNGIQVDMDLGGVVITNLELFFHRIYKD